MIVQVKITKKNSSKPEEFMFMSDTVIKAVDYAVSKLGTDFDITVIEARRIDICDITDKYESELDSLIKYTIGLEGGKWTK